VHKIKFFHAERLVCTNVIVGDQLVRQQAYSIQEEHWQSAGGGEFVSGKDCSISDSEHQLQSINQWHWTFQCVTNVRTLKYRMVQKDGPLVTLSHKRCHRKCMFSNFSLGLQTAKSPWVEVQSADRAEISATGVSRSATYFGEWLTLAVSANRQSLYLILAVTASWVDELVSRRRSQPAPRGHIGDTSKLRCRLLPNLNALVAVSKGMWTLKLAPTESSSS